MKPFLFFILTFISTAILAQNYSFSQIKLDLTEHRKPVYFCFTKDTYNPSFAENDLKTFQSHIKEYLKYNFIFHLENHSKKWEDLALTQHGIQYAMVCELTMRFGIEARLTLYYQNPIRNLQWEQVSSLNESTKEEKDWIKNISFNLSEKLNTELNQDKFDLIWKELEKRDHMIEEQNQEQEREIQNLRREQDQRIKELEILKEEIAKLKDKKTEVLYWYWTPNFVPPVIQLDHFEAAAAGAVIPDNSKESKIKEITIDKESTLTVDLSSHISCAQAWNAVTIGVFIDKQQVGNSAGYWNTAQKGSATVSITGVKYNVAPGTYKIEVRALGAGTVGGTVHSVSLRIMAIPE